ncbi:MAG: TPM domain-containing protein [Lachnospiraceae bacterium]|nr:TPM domain-containing protein [Lachnospiraceae bacterium]
MKIKKKIIHILSLVSICLCMAAGVAVANEDKTRVYDFAALLSASEETELADACLEVEDSIETELYILTTNDAEGKETMEYADDFGDEHAFGYDKEYGDYIILCIDMDNRVVWVSTSGKAIDYLTEARIDALIDDLYGYLTSGDYYNTCLSYIESVTKYMTSEPSYSKDQINPDNYQDTMYVYDEEKSVLSVWYIRLLISLGIGAIAVLIMSFQAKTKVTANAQTYSKGGPRIHRREDKYIRRTTTSRRIESGSSGGGSRSSSGGRHTSSSGRSHGGGGRSF